MRENKNQSERSKRGFYWEISSAIKKASTEKLIVKNPSNPLDAPHHKYGAIDHGLLQCRSASSISWHDPGVLVSGANQRPFQADASQKNDAAHAVWPCQVNAELGAIEPSIIE